MHLTPTILQHAYEYLKECPPFKRWGLPEGESISWHVTKETKREGWCKTSFGKDGEALHTIAASCVYIKTTDALMQIIAHEMVHIRCHMLGVKAHHGYEFKRLAKMVCREHGFREELF